MDVDAMDLLRRGGRGAVRLLDYGVYSGNLELVFAYLVKEYRIRPTAARALALYQAFCAPGAPARIRAASVLPPRGLRLQAAIQRVAQSVARQEGELEGAPSAEATEAPRPAPVPPLDLFDAVLAVATSPDHEAMRRVREAYDPARDAVENLPGGRMTAGQRAFVEKTWRGRLRPLLVRAGFARASTIGG